MCIQIYKVVIILGTNFSDCSPSGVFLKTLIQFNVLFESFLEALFYEASSMRLCVRACAMCARAGSISGRWGGGWTCNWVPQNEAKVEIGHRLQKIVSWFRKTTNEGSTITPQYVTTKWHEGLIPLVYFLGCILLSSVPAVLVVLFPYLPVTIIFALYLQVECLKAQPLLC